MLFDVVVLGVAKRGAEVIGGGGGERGRGWIWLFADGLHCTQLRLEGRHTHAPSGCAAV